MRRHRWIRRGGDISEGAGNGWLDGACLDELVQDPAEPLEELDTWRIFGSKEMRCDHQYIS